MKDTVIKGTGNSRYMKSSISASATWEDMRTLLRNGTFPFDLNGLNEAGIQQQGMALSKANLLSDDTATALGLSGDPTVNNALESIAVELASAIKVEVGSYAGTGASGSGSPNVITFDFVPKLFCILGEYYLNGAQTTWNAYPFVVLIPGLSPQYGNWPKFNGSSVTSIRVYPLFSGNTVSWYSSQDAATQMNTSGRTYYYFVIG